MSFRVWAGSLVAITVRQFFFPLQLLDSLAFHVEGEVERKDKKTKLASLGVILT